MAGNSVTGSFRGIDVSFAYKGPHIVMSVLNNEEDGRRLRVMFQQQPLSGRVNWVSLQLNSQIQDVVVPTEVIQSHKLAFYVDNHEPIATYTEKIVEELSQIQEQLLSDSHSNNATNGSLEQNMNDADEVQLPAQDLNGNNQDINDNDVNDDVSLEDKTMESQNGDSTLDEPDIGTTQSIQPEDDLDNGQTNLEIPNHIAAPKVNRQTKSPADNDDNNSNPNDNTEVNSNISKPESNDEHQSTPKQKKQYIGKYVPSLSTELQFKIKVPSIPKSASKQQATFIPSRTVLRSKSNGKKNRFFGQLAGTFGFTFSNKKKEYYTQQHRHLYEKFHANLEKLESDYNNGLGVALDNWDLESLNEEQTAVLILNLMVNEINAWKKVSQKNEATKGNLAKFLQNIEDELKYTLKQTRGINAPSPTLFPDRTAMNDQDLMNIQEDCDTYLKRFADKLAALEQKHAEKVRLPVFKKFLIEFVRDKLYPRVAEFSGLPSVQSRLNWFLSLVDYEIMPIEPGKTKISPEHHVVKEKRSCDLEPDTVVEVVTPGLQTKDGERVVQNAVVIQAE